MKPKSADPVTVIDSKQSYVFKAKEEKNMATLFNDLTKDSIANIFVIDVYCRCLQILYQK